MVWCDAKRFQTLWCLCLFIMRVWKFEVAHFTFVFILACISGIFNFCYECKIYQQNSWSAAIRSWPSAHEYSGRITLLNIYFNYMQTHELAVVNFFLHSSIDRCSSEYFEYFTVVQANANYMYEQMPFKYGLFRRISHWWIYECRVFMFRQNCFGLKKPPN